MEYLPCVEVESNPNTAAVASVIWLHGLGADGYDFAPLVPELQLPASLPVRFIFPHAPSIPVTINGGYAMPAWYDILEMNLDRKVDETQLIASATAVHQLIDREIARGINSQGVFLAGFSQGGAVVYQAGLTYSKPLAGLLVMSSYFATAGSIQIHAANVQVPILIQHGVLDAVVSETLGQRAYKDLQARGHNVAYETYSMEHSVCAEQISVISDWLQRRLEVSIS
jgi:phospholipase/carboxylesterase